MSKKMCFLVMAHSQFKQLNRLLQALEYPDFDVYLHVDESAETYQSVSNNVVKVHPSISCSWGAFSLVQATLKLLEAAFESGNDYHYYTLLSGADYPVRSNEEIYRSLSLAKSEFLGIYDGDNSFRHDWYRKFHFNEFSYWPRRLIHMFLHRMQGRVWPNRKMPVPLKPFWGSQWWSLTDSAVKYIFEYMDQNPEYLPFFQYTHAPDEMFFHTILMNSAFKTQVEPNLHYIDWKRGGSHPKFMEDSDFDAFSKGRWLFARKFDSDAFSCLLDRIDLELRR